MSCMYMYMYMYTYTYSVRSHVEDCMQVFLFGSVVQVILRRVHDRLLQKSNNCMDFAIV